MSTNHVKKALGLAALLVFLPIVTFAANTYSLEPTDNHERLSTPDSASLSITGDMTLEADIKFGQLPPYNDNIVIAMKTDGDQNRQWKWYIENLSGQVGINLGLSANGVNNYANRFVFTPELDEWHHYAFVYTASIHQVEWFLDGVSQGTHDSTVTSIYDGNWQMNIAGNWSPAEWQQPLAGHIDNFRVWNVARTQAQIAASMDEELTGSETGLKAYYPFNGDYNDITENGNNATSTGSIGFSTDVPFSNGTTTSSTPPTCEEMEDMIADLEAENALLESQLASSTSLGEALQTKINYVIDALEALLDYLT